MLNKKAQATSWSLKEIGELLLRIFAVVLLLVFLVSVINIFTVSKPIRNAYQDFVRVIGEIEDLHDGEELLVPILSENHHMIIRPMEVVKEQQLGCKLDKSDYCACLLNDNDQTLRCKTFNKKDDEKEVVEIHPLTEVMLNNKQGILLIYENDEIILS